MNFDLQHELAIGDGLDAFIVGNVAGIINQPSDRLNLVCGLADRALHTLRSILILCRSGYPEQALILFRSLIETGVNAIFLGSSDDSYTELFINYVDYERGYDMYRIERDYPEQLEVHDPIEVADAINRYKILKPKFHQFAPGSWCGVSSRDRAKKVSEHFGLRQMSLHHAVSWLEANSYVHASGASLLNTITYESGQSGDI